VKVALVIYISLAGVATPWPHKFIAYSAYADCRRAMPAEVAKVRKSYVIANYACLAVPVTPRPR
jgi:hypothetical protein